MKKNKGLLIVVVVLSVIAAGLYFGQKSGTINSELRDFAVKDTAAVVKIFMANKSGDKILLEKKPDGNWTLNSNQWARPDGISTLLKTMHDVEVRSPVGKAAYNSIIKSIAAKGIKVEVYTANGILKTFYVGGPTQDQLGTYMYLENSTVPYVTHIPGFEGYLTPRFIVNENDWLVKNVLTLNNAELKSLSVADKEKPGYLFSIVIDENGNFVMNDEKGSVVQNISQDKIISYLQYFKMLNYESVETTLSDQQIDSLLSISPFRTFTLTEKNGKSTKVDLWRRPITNQTQHKTLEDGTPFPFDVDRMVGSINGKPPLVVVQYFSFDQLFKKPSDFQVLSH
jgi:Domain of unknown function (DUF4340)